MSTRTCSNTNWEKAQISSGVDHFQIISQMVNSITTTKGKLAKEMSYRTPDVNFVDRCNKSIKNCLGTVRAELRKVGVGDENAVSQIVSLVENNDLKKAYKTVCEMVKNHNYSIGYGTR